MRSGQSRFFISVIYASSLILTSPSSAIAGELSVEPTSQGEYGATRKLGRGLTNLSCGWLEIFKGFDEVKSHDNLLAASTWGVAKGVKNSAKRTALGVYEVATFPVPGKKKYEPLMDPEFIFSPDASR